MHWTVMSSPVMLSNQLVHLGGREGARHWCTGFMSSPVMLSNRLVHLGGREGARLAGRVVWLIDWSTSALVD